MARNFNPTRGDILRLMARRRFCVELSGKRDPTCVYQGSDSLLETLVLAAPLGPPGCLQASEKSEGALPAAEERAELALFGE